MDCFNRLNNTPVEVEFSIIDNTKNLQKTENLILNMNVLNRVYKFSLFTDTSWADHIPRDSGEITYHYYEVGESINITYTTGWEIDKHYVLRIIPGSYAYLYMYDKENMDSPLVTYKIPSPIDESSNKTANTSNGSIIQFGTSAADSETSNVIIYKASFNKYVYKAVKRDSDGAIGMYDFYNGIFIEQK